MVCVQTHNLIETDRQLATSLAPSREQTTHIVTPLADTMRFIHHKPCQPIPPRQIPHDAFDPSTHTHHLWRDIHNLGPRVRPREFLMREILIALRHIAGISYRGDVFAEEMSSLVIDERDEGRDDKGHAFGLAQGTDGR